MQKVQIDCTFTRQAHEVGARMEMHFCASEPTFGGGVVWLLLSSYKVIPLIFVYIYNLLTLFYY